LFIVQSSSVSVRQQFYFFSEGHVDRDQFLPLEAWNISNPRRIGTTVRRLRLQLQPSTGWLGGRNGHPVGRWIWCCEHVRLGQGHCSSCLIYIHRYISIRDTVQHPGYCSRVEEPEERWTVVWQHNLCHYNYKRTSAVTETVVSDSIVCGVAPNTVALVMRYINYYIYKWLFISIYVSSATKCNSHNHIYSKATLIS